LASGVGVEKSFLLHSPLVEKVEVIKRSQVRRNYLSYMRARSGKSARLAGVDFDRESVNAPNIEQQRAEATQSEAEPISVETATAETKTEKPEAPAEAKAEAESDKSAGVGVQTETTKVEKTSAETEDDKAKAKKAKAEAFRQAHEK
jgi:large subunit ribosomal protein L19